MRHKLHRAILAVFLTIGIVLSTVSVCHAQDTQLSYQLLERVDGSITYELNVVIPQTLLQYYADKRTSLRVSNFPDFVTPYALEPIASCLWQIYKTDEDFTNGVLMLVHQITYEETTPAKYPVETMVEQKGDCDLFSFIAASILEAGGIHVILLYYESLTHMNIGVQLSEAPSDVRDSVYYVTSGGTKYYIAECTGGNWKEGWRVGECPDDCKQASSKIYTLDNTESIAPGQVSASFNALERSTMSIEISPAFLFENSAVTVRGQISPGRADRNVTIYAKFNFSSWRVVGTTLTKPEGNFEYRWVVDTAGLCEIQASWSGDDQYTGSMSLTRNAIVVPFVIVVLVGVSILVIVVSVVAITISRQARGQVPSNVTPAVTASVFANDL
jgi:hypothetical protein